MIDLTKFMIINEESFNDLIITYDVNLDKSNPNYLNTYITTNFYAYFLIIIVAFTIYTMVHKTFHRKKRF